ncbi:hypothetical protein BC828DRAFT_379696 [Blastocladiella britannica]|nr:hypothetical protein BC828DRAFT_379696 [Blastocladiella britannica]
MTTAPSTTMTDRANMESPTPVVARYSLVALGAGFSTGLVVAAYKRLPVGPTAAGMGFMWGSLGFAYFFTRAHIGNALAAAEAATSNGGGGDGNTTSPLRDRHTLMGSAAAGALVGGAAAVLTVVRRPIPLVASTVAGSLLATTAQMAYTWGRHTRQDLLWRYRQQQQQDQQQTGFLADVKAQIQDVMINTKWLPVRQLTDAEYVVQLEQRLAMADAEIAKFEAAATRLRERLGQE